MAAMVLVIGEVGVLHTEETGSQLAPDMSKQEDAVDLLNVKLSSKSSDQ